MGILTNDTADATTAVARAYELGYHAGQGDERTACPTWCDTWFHAETRQGPLGSHGGVSTYVDGEQICGLVETDDGQLCISINEDIVGTPDSARQLAAGLLRVARVLEAETTLRQDAGVDCG